MNCPTCTADTIVLEKRGLERRRQCTNERCGQRFTTVEKLKDDEQRQARLLEEARELASRFAAEA